VFLKPCDVHPHNQVTDICTAEYCPKRVLCPECRKNHEKTHFPFLKTLHNVTSFAKSELLRMKLDLDDSKSIYQQKVKEVEIAFEDISNQVIEAISKTKEKVLKRLSLIQPDETRWQALVQEHEVAFNRCQNLVTNDEDFIQAVREKYAQKCAEIVSSSAKFRRKLQGIKNQVFFHSEEKDLLMNKIRASLIDFQNFFISGDEALSEFHSISNFSLENLKLEKIINYQNQIHLSSFTCLPEKNLLAIGDIHGYLSLINGITLKPLMSSKIHSKDITNIKYSASKNMIITSSLDGTLKFFRINKGFKLTLQKAINQLQSQTFGLLVLDKADTLLTSDESSQIKVWNLNTLKMKSTISTNGKAATLGANMVYISKKNWVAVPFKDGMIGLYEIHKGKEVAMLPVFSNNLFRSTQTLSSLVFLEQQNSLIALVQGVGQKGLKIWKLEENGFEFTQEYSFPGELPMLVHPVNNQELLLFTSLSPKLYLLDLKVKKWKETSKDLEIKESFALTFSSMKKRLFVFDSDRQSPKIAVLTYK